MTFQKNEKNMGPIIHCHQKDLTDDEWHLWRSGGIGGSDAAVALAMVDHPDSHPYKSPLNLYMEKVLGIRDFQGNEATRWGHLLEESVALACQEDLPDLCQVVEVLPLMSHRDHNFMKATTDFGIDGTGGKGLIECKTSLNFFGSQKFKETIPPHYYWQCIHYLAVDTTRQFCILAALVEGPKFLKYLIERNEEEISLLIEAEKLLWDAMKRHDIKALVDGSKNTSEALIKLFPKVKERAQPLDLSNDEKALAATRQYITSKKFEKAAGQDKKEAENTLKALMGDAETMLVQGVQVQWKETKKGRRFSVHGDFANKENTEIV